MTLINLFDVKFVVSLQHRRGTTVSLESNFSFRKKKWEICSFPCRNIAMSEMAQVHANHEEKYDFYNLGINIKITNTNEAKLKIEDHKRKKIIS